MDIFVVVIFNSQQVNILITHVGPHSGRSCKLYVLFHFWFLQSMMNMFFCIANFTNLPDKNGGRHVGADYCHLSAAYLRQFSELYLSFPASTRSN